MEQRGDKLIIGYQHPIFGPATETLYVLAANAENVVLADKLDHTGYVVARSTLARMNVVHQPAVKNILSHLTSLFATKEAA